MIDMSDTTKLVRDLLPNKIELLESNCSQLEAKLSHAPSSKGNITIHHVPTESICGGVKCYDMVYDEFSGRVYVSHNSILYTERDYGRTAIVDDTQATMIYRCPCTGEPTLEICERVSGSSDDLVDAFIDLFHP